MRESVPIARYSPVCNVLRQWKTSLILTYRVYRLYDIYIYIYSRTGFKCKHVIIANCDFSPSAQLLERNVYITRIHTYVRTYGCNQYVARV